MGYGHLENAFEVDEQGFVGYFEATYIGRRVVDGRRNPLSGQAIWNVASRMTLGPLRANNADESFRNAFSSGVARADRPAAYRLIQSIHRQKNISCGSTADKPRDRRDRAASLERSRKEARGAERAFSEPHRPVPGASRHRPLPQRRILALGTTCKRRVRPPSGSYKKRYVPGV